MELKTESAIKIQRYWRNKCKCKLKDTGYSSDTDTDTDTDGISLRVLNYDTESARHLNTNDSEMDTEMDTEIDTEMDTEIDIEMDTEIDTDSEMDANHVDLEVLHHNSLYNFVKSIFYLLPLLIVIFNYYT